MTSRHLVLLKSLAAQLDGRPWRDEAGEVDAGHYVSPACFERERATVFARVPQIVALDCELSAPGARAAVEIAGVSSILVRGDDGEVRAFKNACRHRSTRLVGDGPPCVSKAIVCPYHGWSYDLRGERIHAPHAESFCGLDRDRSALLPLWASARYGLVFAGLEPFDLDPFLAPIAEDLAELGGATWHLFRRTDRAVAGNWKLIIDAFLDGYHIRHLHRDSIYRFFLDACFQAEPAGPHIRALTGRRTLVEARGALDAIEDVRSVATPSYLVFPNTIIILHPDYLSVAVAMPVAVDRTHFVHWMMTPEPPRTEIERQHFEKSFELIDGGVFASEDLAAVEAMQRGLATGANRSQLFGEQESPCLWFHRALQGRGM
jgi:phenylpropionate dioxygenase-like ring-hydroxylating dioxygenase large terminal subunit